jgi:hypothetical protein
MNHFRRRIRTAGLLHCLFGPGLILNGCSRDPALEHLDHVEVRDTIGDTIFVRTTSGSRWSDPVSLIEELRIGKLDGSEEETFGAIMKMAVDSEGGVYVFDNQVPALRHFDANGQFVRTLGREGSGPGEYRNLVMGLAVRRDKRIILRDHQNARFNLYELDGSFSESWFYGSGLMSTRGMFTDTADHTYLRISGGPAPQGEVPASVFAHFDDRGNLLETIRAPTFEHAPKTTVGGVFPKELAWGISPLGYLVSGVNDEYTFDLHPPGGPVIRVSRAVPPVPLNPEERAEHEARRDWSIRHESQFLPALPPPVPDQKPAYRDFYFGSSGTIWVHRYVEAKKQQVTRGNPNPSQRPPLSWREPTVFDVFDTDGSFLGEVTVRPRTSLYVFGRDHVWGVTSGERGESYVVRFRIRHGLSN